ncbi:MAG: hypothetical protein VR66_02190 [Peptococcaceae bacterium BRH_c23]|nr:MAG: hypothetical protein VR66_02190 [Peptococcaceae bacterium BRH_c23]KJS82868.1 MAG: hypothetical protein JL57_23835 [Desulfosporosinus sp. BICA1-9]
MRLLEVRELVLIVLILLGGFAMSLVSPIFLNPANLLAILLGVSIDGIIAAGMTVLLVSGGFDLSVGSTLALSGIVTCLCIKAGFPVPLAVSTGILSGALVGLVNGLIVTKWRIHPFIVTLGMLSIVRGFVLILAKGVTIVELPKSFTILGQGKVFGVQFPIIITIIVIILGDILLRKTRFFRQSYYIGGNEKAAIMTGIKVNKVKIISYVIVGALSAMAGVLIASRLGAASVNIGVGEELKVITACVIGGASLNGGEGSVVGAFLGTLLMAILLNSLNLLGIDVYWQNVATGVILIAAVVLDTDLKRRREDAAQ